MKLYGGIDLHSNNLVLCLLDDSDSVVYQKRMGNELLGVLEVLEPHRESLEGLVVESTYNWYWLVDGLIEAGYRMHLANTAAIQQYSGLKYSDARWLGNLLRLGLLPEGYIYPKHERAVRDLLRKRSQLVQQRTRGILSVQNLYSRNTGRALSGQELAKLSAQEFEQTFGDDLLGLAASSQTTVVNCLEQQIEEVEKAVLERMKLDGTFRHLLTVRGIGKVLALTIALEVGDIGRFKEVGQFASYCRCVDSQRISNGKRKGRGNTKNGNKYLAWAFIEAANFAIRYEPRVRAYYERKRKKTKRVVALKAVAHKLARACYYVMRDEVAFNAAKAFG